MSFLDGREHALFHARFDASSVPQAVLNTEAEFELVNAAFADLLGRAPEELIGRHPYELRHDSDLGGADRTLAGLLPDGESVGQTERIFAHASGAPVPVLVSFSAIIADDGSVEGLSAFYQDLRILRDSERRLEFQEQFYFALGQRARDAALILDPTGMLIYVSPAVKTLFGYEAADIVSLDAFALVHPDDAPMVRADFDAVVSGGGTRVAQFRLATADDKWRWVQQTATNLLHTPIGGVVCNLLDITEQREAEARLRVEQLRNEAIVETTREGIWVVAPDGRTEFANERMAEMLGLSLAELHARKPAAILGDEDALKVRTRSGLRHITGDEQHELDYLHPDGSTRRLLVSAAPFAVGDGAFTGVLAMISDVTDQRRMEEELRHAALHDPLTGLPNRTLLADRLEQALLRRRDSHGVVSLLFVDLDQFKLINDLRGHDVGDQVLMAVASRLSAAVRAEDTVARLGGDEFVVLCTGDELSADGLAARIAERLAEPVVLDHHRVGVTASIGVASSPPYEGSDLLRYADTAMFAAKSAGRARVRIFDSSLEEETARAHALAGDLRTAIDDDALAMRYQPVIDLTNGTVIGYEALARWTHPTHDAVEPSTFVPIAEQMGLSRSLDRWAVRRAIADLDALRQSGRARPETFVSVNLSAQHLAERDLEQAIVSATAAVGLPPRNVCLEITESAVMRDMFGAVQVLNSLRDRGYRIAIDDFGTGHSSMAYLRNLPITALKIDRAFVADITADDDALAIVTSITQLADAIGVTAIAEGVETVEQAHLLRDLGCSAAQGWLWSDAMTLVEIAAAPQRFALAG